MPQVESDNPYESPLTNCRPDSSGSVNDDRARRSATGRRAAAVLLLASLPAYIACGALHICMAGHMQHPPYPAWQYATDGVWVVGLAVGAILSAINFRRMTRSATAGAAALWVSRLLLGSGGGIFFLLELPAIVVVLVAAVFNLGPTRAATR
jgi:hypothetical protein